MMNRHHAIPLSLLASLLAVGAACCSGSRAQGEGDIDVSFSLESSLITLHQPVLVRLAVKNQSAQTIKLRLGRDRKENFAFTLTRPDGKKQQLPPLPVREGLFDPGAVSLSPGAQLSHRLLLNEWTTFPAPGKYSLDVRLLTPIETGTGAGIQAKPYHASFEILSRDDALLIDVCESLAEQIESSDSVREARDAAAALAHVDDPLVVPYLERALRSGKYVEAPIMDGLVRIGTADAARVLISILEESSPPDMNTAAETRANLARQALQAIEANTLDEGLKQEIGRALPP